MSAHPIATQSLPRAEAALGLLGGPRASWQRQYVLLLLGMDLVGLGLVTAIGVLARFGLDHTVSGLPYWLVAAGITSVWVLTLACSRCYEGRFIMSEAHEYLHSLQASGSAFAVVCLISFVTKAHVSRLYLLIVFPLGVLALLLSRFGAHRVLARARRRGHAQHLVVVVGDPTAYAQVAEAFRAESSHAHRVVGACFTVAGSEVADLHVPVSLGLQDVSDVVRSLGADTVAVTTGPSMSREILEQLCYQLEGQGVDLLVAPSLADISGPRISVRPVAGVPLMHLDEPELDGVHKLMKGAFDRSSAAAGLLMLLPALLLLSALVRFTSDGPVIFKQARVGKNGRTFLVWKFRSMYPDAEARLAELRHLNEGGGPLFKMKNDPRITPIGRFLRKWSLDELPQLVNVLKGDMSLVGPRPPLPSEVAQYEGHAHRRLLVKPGITGLWQVSGRSDLDWEQTVRLDLAYVDGWSLGFDLAILARTALAVVRSSGAY